MTTFGETLRSYRQASNDPDRLNRRLSQERLGELIGDVMDDAGVSGAAVSYWESGESKINAEDRQVLIALIKILYRCGGLRTLMEANHFLELGNYRALNVDESQEIFGEQVNNSNPAENTQIETTHKSNLLFLIEDLFAVSEEELSIIIAEALEGPAPIWPRILAAFLRKASERFSISLTTILWVWVWLIAWWLISPSLHLPFPSQTALLSAIQYFVAGSLIVPLLIGLLVNTRDNEYWKSQPAVKTFWLRLYTYQGAGIGFNLGYFFIFPFSLAGYYLQLGYSPWFSIVAATAGLLLGNMGARVVPHNLWLAYHRLNFSDGAIFFVVALLGPLWGFFFINFYPILLTPVTGIFVILLALAIMIIVTTQQFRKSW